MDAAELASGVEPESGLEQEPEPLIAGGRPSWLRRWTRRLANTFAFLFVVLTGSSVTYNTFTDGRASVPPGLTYVTAAGIKTRYVEWGSSGSPIVLVHGFIESADSWQQLAAVLARSHRVYALDLTGYGYSDRRAPYTTDHLAEQLLGFVNAMGLGSGADRPIVVGHSSGAAVAAEAALRAPNEFSGLMFLDGDGLPTPSAPSYVLLDPYRTSLLRLVLGSDWVIREIYSVQCGPTCPRLDAAGVDRWRRPFQVAGAEGGLWSMMSVGSAGLPAARLAQLTSLCIPKAVVFGADDGVFEKSAPQTTASRIGAPPPTVIPGARHLTMISSPDVVAAAVEALAVRVGTGHSAGSSCPPA